MRKRKPTIALIYDFDGTLSPSNMQEYDSLKKSLGQRTQTQGSICEMPQLASVSITKTLLRIRIFGRPNNNIVNELDESSEPTLF